MNGSLRVLAPAKVNLHLAVGSMRSDGYHNVTTVLHALSIHDTVSLADAGDFTFSCVPDLGLAPGENLAHRAALLMAEHYHRPLDVSVRVEKRIPAGAGLGGASADAAAVIVGLAAWWGLDAADPVLVAIARSLGSDVPFFLGGGAALFTGRGDVLAQRLRPLAAHAVLAQPAAPVSSADAYRAFDALPSPPARPETPLIDALEAGDLRSVAHRLSNNMTTAAISLVPDIGAALDMVRDAPGVLGAIMAGSGSVVFGICEDATSAASAARAMREAGLWAEATTTSPDGCVVERL